MPTAAASVQRIIDLNGLRDAVVVPIALADASGIQALHIPEGDHTSATLDAALRPGRSTERLIISKHSLDEVWTSLSEGRSVSAIKIDVEGAELQALRGMRHMLARERPTVLCEVLDVDSRADRAEHDQRVTAIEELLEEVGYSIHQVVKPAGSFDGLLDLRGFPRRTWSQDTAESCDYLLSPNP